MGYLCGPKPATTISRQNNSSGIESQPLRRWKIFLANCFIETTHHQSTIEGVTYAADMALFTNYCKIPAVLFGPGDVRRAHSINEYVEIDDVLMCVKTIANLIVNWCGETIE